MQFHQKAVGDGRLRSRYEDGACLLWPLEELQVSMLASCFSRASLKVKVSRSERMSCVLYLPDRFLLSCFQGSVLSCAALREGPVGSGVRRQDHQHQEAVCQR